MDRRHRVWLSCSLIALASLGCRRHRRAAPHAVPVAAGDCAAAHPSPSACVITTPSPQACAAEPRLGCAAEGDKAPAGMAVLRGVVQEADVDPARPAASATVRFFAPDGKRAVDLRAGADGAYAALVPIGQPVFYASTAPGWLGELHAIAATEAGARMELQLRHAPFFERVLSMAGRHFDASKALVVVELLGAPEGGVGAVIAPAAERPFVLAREGEGMKAIEGDRLVPRGHHLVIYPNVTPGEITVTLLDSERYACRLAASPARWPSRPGVITQVDATCTAKP